MNRNDVSPITSSRHQLDQENGSIFMQPYARSDQFRLSSTPADSAALQPASRTLGSAQMSSSWEETESNRLNFLNEEIRFEHEHKADPLAVSSLVAARPVYFAAKRALDLMVTLAALVVLLPVLAFIALLIAWDSPGPVIFKQTRVGAKPRRNGDRMYWRRQDFTFYKFRSMRSDADPELHRKFVEAYIEGDAGKMMEIQPEKSGVDMFKLNGDPRVTRIGKFLRKTSLDELPQLWNVLAGDMSLVGPRPPIPYEVDMYSARSMQRLATVPGMTGLWQMTGRGELGFTEQVELDVEYIERQSFWLDIKILVGTIPAVLLSKGAK